MAIKGQASSSFIIYNMGEIHVDFVRVKLDEFSIYTVDETLDFK